MYLNKIKGLDEVKTDEQDGIRVNLGEWKENFINEGGFRRIFDIFIRETSLEGCVENQPIESIRINLISLLLSFIGEYALPALNTHNNTLSSLLKKSKSLDHNTLEDL